MHLVAVPENQKVGMSLFVVAGMIAATVAATVAVMLLLFKCKKATEEGLV